jgi:agmatinase
MDRSSFHDMEGVSYVDGVNPFGGIPTFGGFPADDWRSFDRADVAVIGVPYDNGTANRPGCRFGPRSLRADAFTPGYHHLDLDVNIREWLDVRDVGDVYCPHGMPDVALSNAAIAVERVARRADTVIVLGGDHSITWPSALAVARTHGWGRLGMIHFDAHADAADEMDGNVASHATPMRRLLESGALAEGGFVQIGLRGYWPGPEVFDFLRSVDARWYLGSEVRERGLPAIVEEALERLQGKIDALYLSIDIDVIDPAFAPGTGTPEPGGMLPNELFAAVRQIVAGANVKGIDVMEVSPPFDVSDLTVNVAHRVVFESLAALADRKRGASS